MSDPGDLHRRPPIHGKLPETLMHNPAVTDGAKVLYAHMHWRYGKNQENYEGMRSMAEQLGVTPKTIANRVKELEAADWVISINRGVNKHGNYQTTFYHVFERQEDCIKFRETYKPTEGETIEPKPESRQRKSRAGAGNPSPVAPHQENSGSHSHENSSSDGCEMPAIGDDYENHKNLSSDGHENLSSDDRKNSSSSDQENSSSDNLAITYLATNDLAKEKTTTTPKVVVVAPEEKPESEPLDITPQFKQVNPDFARISRAYEQNIGIVSAAIRDRLNMALTDFPADWIVEAIEEAVIREKRFWSYVDSILKNWKRDGKNKKPPTGSAAPSPMPDSNTEAFIAAQSESDPAPLTPPDESVNTTVGKYGKTALEAWNAAYSQLEHTYDRATFMTWIQDSRLIRVDDGAFVIEAKNDYAMSVCRDRLYRAIHRTVADCYGDEVRLEFVSRTPTPTDPLEKIGERMKQAKAAERERLGREQGDAA